MHAQANRNLPIKHIDIARCAVAESVVTRHIAYISKARPGLSAQCIDALLLDARAFNARIGVTGVLLYDGQRFFQYFEGSDYATDQVMSRIQASPRHSAIHLLSDGRHPRQQFDRWYMGFCHSPATFIQRLENGNWQQTLYTLRQKDSHCPVLEALNQFLAEQPAPASIGQALTHP